MNHHFLTLTTLYSWQEPVTYSSMQIIQISCIFESILCLKRTVVDRFGFFIKGTLIFLDPLYRVVRSLTNEYVASGIPYRQLMVLFSGLEKCARFFFYER